MRLRAALMFSAVLAAGSAFALDTAPVRMSFGTWGYDTGGQNTGVKPGDDFNGFANGGFLDRLTIPADRSSYGVDAILGEEAQAQLRAILEDSAAPADAAADAAKARTLYRAFMDQHRVDALGAAPLAKDLAAIRASRSRADLAAVMGGGAMNFQGALFDVSIQTDAKSPDRYAVVVAQAGLGLPDRDYYLKPAFAKQKAAYRDYIAQLLTLAGWPDAAAKADAVVAYETRIAEASWAREDERDPNKIYNPMSPAELAKAAPGFDWARFLAAAWLSAAPRVIVQENSALLKLAAIYAATPLEVLKAAAAFHLADNAAPNLAATFADAQFAFRGTVLSGQPSQKPRWKRAVALVDRDVGEAVGRLYVARYFPPQAKAQIGALVDELKVAMAARIQTVVWMSPQTKTRAIEKLGKMTVKLGYPNHWRDYSRLSVRADDLYGDIERATAFEWNRQVSRLNQPVDRSEWLMTPQTVNAYYEPTANEIVFPAAQLQPPYFNLSFDAAANYGGIGGVIGHEMTHGFDDEGRDFDGNGALANWWSPEDGPKFDARAAALAAQYDTFEPYPGAHVNGKLTDGENIADLGGLLIALDAYHRSLHGQPAPVIGGLTGDQRFFLAYAQSWRTKRREAAVRSLVVSNPHAPEQYRVNGVVRNVDAWYEAFGVSPGDKLFVAPADRVHIW